MKGFIVFLLMIIHTGFIGYIWYNTGYDDAMKDINNSPSAMDVYMGKTTLQYTVVGGEKTDSVVIFK